MGANRTRGTGKRWLGILAGAALSCAALALDPAKAVAQYTLDTWTREEGLPQASVQTITQTRDGYLWLGTMEGLVRFDGVTFAQIDDQDIWHLFEARDGTLWVSTYNGLVALKDGRTTRYTTREGLPSDRISGVCEDDSGNLWIATNTGLARLAGGRFTVLGRRDGLPGEDVTAVLAARGGSLWVGTRNGLALYEGGRFTTFGTKDGLPSEHVRRLFEDSQATLWVGTAAGGLCAYRKGRFTVYGQKEGLPDLDVRAIAEDRDGSLWVGTQTGGVARLRDGRFETLGVKEGLSDSAVWSIYEDREGSLWVGTFSGGLDRLKDEKFTTFDSAVGLSNNTAWVLCEGEDRTLWIGTDVGVNALKDGKFTVYTTRDGLPNDGVTALLEDRDGALWVGTDGGGLARLKDGRFTVYGKEAGLSYPNVYSLCEDRRGRIWIGTNGGGLYVLQDGKMRAFTRKDGLGDDYVRALLEDRQGSLWIGTNGGGLNRLKDGVFTLYTTREGLSDNFIRDLYEDRDGTLWIGTRNGGLCRMRDGKFTSFGARDGLLSNVVFRILEDGQGTLWMSCNRGVFRAAKSDLEAFAAGRTQSVPCASFGRADGMKSAECNGGTQPAGCRTRDGRIWFPTLRGVVCTDPQHPRLNAVPPPVVVEEVLADGRPLALSGDAVVPAGADRFEFHFTALSLFSPGRVRFRYRLEGHDKAWNELDGGRERVAVYTNLPPGRHTFQVLACNNDGVWNEKGASFAFRLKPEFHQTWVFYALLALGLLTLGGALYHAVGVALGNLRVGRSLSRYHSRHVIEKLRNHKGGEGALLASERRRVSVLFCDLTGFSDFSDHNEPEAVNRVINDYLTEMSAILDGRGGTIARFMGDGIMAFFGAPGEMEPAEQARRAVAAGIAMQKRMEGLGEAWLQSGLDHDLRMRVGISQDYATVGNFGSRELMEYTALGSTVNLAARLEAACTPGCILVSFPVYAATKDLYAYAAPEQREFKGFARPIHVAELTPPAAPG